jgi:hypothetical protein
MAASSKHYGDVVNWLEKVIDSCETPLQELTARKLVRLFESQYQNIDRELNWDLSRRLRVALDNKVYGRLEKKFNPEEFTQQQQNQE